MNKKRNDLPGDGKRLTENPFGVLADLKAGMPQAPTPVETDVASHAKAPNRPYEVGKTRKGGLPVFVEKRAKGKTVTVVRNVSGDAEALLKLLKKRCGAGGVLREGDVEIQGDHRAAVENFLSILS